MQVYKLNCEACGAPISVPEDVDYLNCAACGSYLVVERGADYYALREVKKMTDAIEKSGQATQEIIRDSSQATQVELRKMQLTQELSMIEMQLNGLRGEVRGLERVQNPQKPDPKVKRQLDDLHNQEYQTIGRMQDLHLRIAKLSVPDPDEDIQALTTQLSLTRVKLQILQKVSWHPGITDQMNELRSKDQSYIQKIFRLRVKETKAGLPSFKLVRKVDLNLENARDGYLTTTKDIKQLEKAPQSPENKAVLNELRAMQREYYANWSQLETARIQYVLQSGHVSSPKGMDIRSIEDQLGKIQHDIHFLAGTEKNPVSEAYLNQLYRQERSFRKHLEKLRRQAHRGEKSFLAALGIGALLAGISASVGNLFSPKEPSRQVSPQASGKPISIRDDERVDLPESKTEKNTAESDSPTFRSISDNDVLEETISEEVLSTELTPLYDLPGQVTKRVLIGILLFSLPLLSLSCLYLLGVAVFTGEDTSVSNIQITGLLVVAFVGFCLGALVFFRHLGKGNIRSSTIAGLKAIAVLLGTGLLCISITFGVYERSVDASTWIFAVGLCLSPLAGLIFFIWQVRQSRLKQITN